MGAQRLESGRSGAAAALRVLQGLTNCENTPIDKDGYRRYEFL